MSCGPVIIYPPCPTDCPQVVAYLPQNGNLIGIGVLDNFDATANEGTYRGVVGDGTYLTATLDAANKAIVLTFNAAAVATPQATEILLGGGEIATTAEAQALASDTLLLTPLKLSQVTALTTRPGIVELSTDAENLTGTDTTRAVTPAGMATQRATIKQTRIFANAAARAAATPDFDGQLGVQLDTEGVFTSTGLAAGNWQSSFIQPNTVTTFTALTTFDVGTADLIYKDGATDMGGWYGGTGFVVETTMYLNSQMRIEATGGLNFIAGSEVQVASVAVPANSVIITNATPGEVSSRLLSRFFQTDTTTTLSSNTEIEIAGSNFRIVDGGSEQLTVSGSQVLVDVELFINAGTEIAGGAAVNFGTTTTIEVNSVTVPANSVLVTSATAGRLTNKLINTFISTSNTQAWAAPTGLTSRATFDPATVTLPELGQRFAALLTDLMNTLKPSL